MADEKPLCVVERDRAQAEIRTELFVLVLDSPNIAKWAGCYTSRDRAIAARDVLMAELNAQCLDNELPERVVTPDFAFYRVVPDSPIMHPDL